MKLLLTRNRKERINGYETVSAPLALVRNDIKNIDDICCDAEATDIKVDNFLSLYDYDTVRMVLLKICSKLRIGGEIVVTDLDFDLVAYASGRGLIEEKVLNELLFTEGALSSFFGAESIVETLTSAGIHITERYIENNRNFVVKGVRC
jgi:hypothetical protein